MKPAGGNPYGLTDQIRDSLKDGAVTASHDLLLYLLINRSEGQVPTQVIRYDETGGDQIRITIEKGGDHRLVIFHDQDFKSDVQVIGKGFYKIVFKPFRSMRPFIVAGPIVAGDDLKNPSGLDSL